MTQCRALIILFVYCLFAGAEPRKVKNKIMLDVKAIEEAMSRLAAREPLADSKWLGIVGEHKGETYEIRSGDNLWYISKRLFGDAFLWRKLWEVNSVLSNPHELSVGSQLLYYNPNRRPASIAEIKIPLYKLVPPREGKAVNLDDDAVINLSLVNRFRPVTFVLTPEDEVFGEITGSTTYGVGLLHHEPIFVTDDSGKLRVGERYGVVRYERPLRDSTDTNAPVIGSLVRLVGEIQIEELGELLVKARVRDLYAVMKRGDKLVRTQPAASWDKFMDPPENLQARVIMGEEAENKFFGQGNLVMLNKGESDGMKVGYVFRVWHDRDASTDRVSDVEPISKGEIRVIHVSPLSSVGFIVRNSEVISIGDFLVPRQTFSNPKPIEALDKVVLEIP